MANPFTFAWELSHANLQLFTGTSFQKRLTSILAHTLLLGIHLAAGSGLVSDPNSNTAAFTRLNKYIKKAIKDQIGQDKFYPLRSCTTSVGYMRTHLDFNSRSELDIFQVAIWRVYCFGYEQRFKDLTLPPNTTQPDLLALQITIERHISDGNVKLSMAPYGQLMIPKKDFTIMLHKLWRFARRFAKSENQSASFSAMYEWICMEKIPSLPRNGLLTWLLTCDFAELKLCNEPTIKDLADHMSKTSQDKPGGPTKALKTIALWEKGKLASKDDLEAELQFVWDVLTDPNSPVAQITELQKKCAVLQGRELSVIDLEHLLCKIARQLPPQKKPKKSNDDEENAEDEAIYEDDDMVDVEERSEEIKSTAKKAVETKKRVVKG